MKKLLKFSLMLLVATFIFSSCSSDDDDYDIVIDPASLPQAARTFVSQYFPSEKITIG